MIHLKAVLKVLYNEPVVFLGCLSAAAVALVQGDVIAAWIALVVVAVVTPIQRYFVTPVKRVK